MPKYKEKAMKKEFLILLRRNHNVIQPCLDELGIGRWYYHKWMKDLEFKEEVLMMDSVTDEWVESKFFELIRNGDKVATMFYLKTKLGDKYQEKQIIDNTHSYKEPLVLNINPPKLLPPKLLPPNDQKLIEE